MSLADLSLTSADGSIHLHDVELGEDEFGFLGRVADLFAAADPGGYTPALLVARAPLVVSDDGLCHFCGESRPARKGDPARSVMVCGIWTRPARKGDTA